jgi:hypothetical protein
MRIYFLNRLFPIVGTNKLCICIFIEINTRVINYIMLKYRIVDFLSEHNQIIIFLIKNILEKVRPKSIYYYFTH